MSFIFIGIDPGLKGGIAILGSGQLEAAGPMPVQGNEIDPYALAQILKTAVAGATHVRACVEKVGAMPKQGLSSTFKFGKGYGTVIGVLGALGIPYDNPTPQAWKAKVLAGTAKDKDAAIAFCRQMYPKVDLILPRCRTPSDGLADALCLAHYIGPFA